MVIRAKNLSFSYPGRPVLRAINLNVAKGEFLGITGPTGSGKSTLAYCLNGIIPNSVRGKFSGNVNVCGLDTKKNKLPDLARKVGLVFQDPDWQLFSLSVKVEVSFGLKNLCMDEIERRTHDALEQVGLAGLDDTEPHKLSQGQKQKLCIASVIAMDPDVIVLDEPTSNLDHGSTMNVYVILKDMNLRGKTIVVIEHDTDLLLEFTGKTLLMEGGRLVRFGETGKVLKDRNLLKDLGIKVPWRLAK
jgi:energy-coupling factor transporter ATP-binding protein EcfA2